MEHTSVYLLLGTNTNCNNLRLAAERLRPICSVITASSVYRTAAQGEAGGADYFNQVIQLTTGFATTDFKAALRQIEAEIGRVRGTQEVAIDLDILLWGDGVFSYGEKPWRVPAPDILRYAHAAVPLAEIVPDLRHPETGETMAAIAARLGDVEIIRLTPTSTE
jgi:2-amino-4-hydroxy-6-hydroxymethyldihydropteridine diphosphokinase